MPTDDDQKPAAVHKPSALRSKAPPFKQRLKTAIDVGKEAGASRIKVSADGTVELDFRSAALPEINDFDRPPNPVPTRKGNAGA